MTTKKVLAQKPKTRSMALRQLAFVAKTDSEPALSWKPFQKNAPGQLSLSESASLDGIIKEVASYCIAKHGPGAHTRLLGLDVITDLSWNDFLRSAKSLTDSIERLKKLGVSICLVDESVIENHWQNYTALCKSAQDLIVHIVILESQQRIIEEKRSQNTLDILSGRSWNEVASADELKMYLVYALEFLHAIAERDRLKGMAFEMYSDTYLGTVEN